MLFQSSHFIWSFMSLLTLYQDYAASVNICQPGQRLTRSKNGCEACPANQYNPKLSSSTECRNCELCGLYSYQVMPCSPKSNTKCQCHEGFIPFDKTTKRCKCEIGSGIKMSEKGKHICEKCPPKTFTSQINSQCQPQCMQKIPGNASEVKCGNEPKTVLPPSSSLALSQTSSITSTTAAPTTNVLSSPTNSITELHHSRKHAIWLAFLAAFLLLILILKLSRCSKKKTGIVRQGSECGKPVEESGEKFIPGV